ncbi:hypothetical protein [Wolbachia endosymbiont of Folsomia candida]|uniref:hypothetical protein n=1 Tax=Wolbachia endosymbiont of Folsomia candida TaxID=169402 RepID=UPI000ACD1D00|nr:hypothetical protein [Wolbachia endosymbiont of Folsomia candida]APR98407.1 hypothetical protein ASM33_03930 [Wolbachia endosymbiont of Folsomia candida]
MVTTIEKLTPEQQTLYNNLKDAIQSGVAANVDKVISAQTRNAQTRSDLLSVFKANPKLYDLLNYTTDKGREVAWVIKGRAVAIALEFGPECMMYRNFMHHLCNKRYDAVISNNTAVAEGILEFAKPYGIDLLLHWNLRDRFEDELKDAILSNKQKHANKIFSFAKNYIWQESFIDFLEDILLDAIHHNKKDNVVGILNFASTNNFLKDVLSRRYIGGTPLEFAKRENRTQIVKIIEEKIKEAKLEPQEPPIDSGRPAFPEPTSDRSLLPPHGEQVQSSKPSVDSGRSAFPGLTSDRSFPFSMSGMDSYHYGGWDDSDETPTFYSKHGGKIAFGTVGLLLVIGGAVLAFVLGQPLIGIAAAVAGAALLATVVLAITTEKGQKMWDQASDKLSDKLSDLFVSKQESNLRNI